MPVLYVLTKMRSPEKGLCQLLWWVIVGLFGSSVIGIQLNNPPTHWSFKFLIKFVLVGHELQFNLLPLLSATVCFINYSHWEIISHILFIYFFVIIHLFSSFIVHCTGNAQWLISDGWMFWLAKFLLFSIQPRYYLQDGVKWYGYLLVQLLSCMWLERRVVAIWLVRGNQALTGLYSLWLLDNTDANSTKIDILSVIPSVYT